MSEFVCSHCGHDLALGGFNNSLKCALCGEWTPLSQEEDTDADAEFLRKYANCYPAV